jgi:hypothetical protein
MIKETVVAVSIVTMAAGAALAPSAVSAAQDGSIVVADSHGDACNPCGGEEEEESSLGDRIIFADDDACNPCGGEEEG